MRDSVVLALSGAGVVLIFVGAALAILVDVVQIGVSIALVGAALILFGTVVRDWPR